MWSQGEELCAVALQEEVFKYLSSLTANETVLFAISCLYLIPRRLSLVCKTAPVMLPVTTATVWFRFIVT